MKTLVTTTLSLLIAVCALPAWAQRDIDDEFRVDTTEEIIKARNQREEITAQLASWLALSHQSQIELGQLASERTQRASVDELADKMVEHHTQMLKELQQFLPEVEVEERTETELPAEKHEIAEQQHGVLLEVGRKTGQFRLALTKQLLEKYEGQDFDMGYLGQQLIAHVGVLSTMEAMKQYGTDEFQQVVAAQREKIKDHIREIHELSRKLEDERELDGETASEAADKASAPADIVPRATIKEEEAPEITPDDGVQP